MVISVHLGTNENHLNRETDLYYCSKWEDLIRGFNSDMLTAWSKNVIKPGWRKSRKEQHLVDLAFPPGTSICLEHKS